MKYIRPQIIATIGPACLVMLSEETASGKYPSKAVAMMKSVLMESEKHFKNTKVNPL